jgi:hypothetical protein
VGSKQYCAVQCVPHKWQLLSQVGIVRYTVLTIHVTPVKGVSVSKEAQVAGSERKTETKKETKLINSVSDEKDTNAESVSSAPRLYEPPQQSKPKKSRRTSYDTPKSDKLVPGQMLGEKYKTQNVIPGLESDQDEEFEEAGSESD